MVIQYFIVAAIVAIVLVLQYRTYKKNEDKIADIRNLFPSSNTTSIENDEENGVPRLVNSSAPNKFKTTLDDINSYLKYNKNKTYDYQILKEIVNRNSQSLEDEVDTMLTVPLYWGLIATIFGIAFGIVIFAWKDLANLLAGANMNTEGIKILLTDVGIAMGGAGSQAAIEAADIVIMDDSLSKISVVMNIARRTQRIAKENVVFALSVKGIVLLLGAIGIANMWMAVFGDVGVACLAILNAMRAMRVNRKL